LFLVSFVREADILGDRATLAPILVRIYIYIVLLQAPFYPSPTWGIRIWIFLGEAQMEYNIIFPRIFNDIPFIGSRIFHFEAKPEYNIVFFFAPRIPHVGS